MPSQSHPKLRVAAVQAAPVFLDLDATIDKTIHLMQQAAELGAKLVAFPETWIPGYPWWIWLNSPAMGMRFVPRYNDNSLIVHDAVSPNDRGFIAQMEMFWLASVDPSSSPPSASRAVRRAL